MKHKLLSLALLASSFVVAQEQTFSAVTIQKYSPLLYLKRDTNEGGFIRGIQTQFANGDNGWFFGDLHGSQWVVSKGDYRGVKFMIHENGNVGIGASNPLAKLDVFMGNADHRNLVVGKFSTSGATGGSNMVTLGYHNSANLELNSGYTNVGLRYGNYFDFNIENDNSANPDFGSINFISSKKIQMSIKPNGNAFLQGKFEAKEIKVTNTPTADFVFDENYHLPKLEDIEKHIKEKKHLPEIASAKVMEQEGVDIGAFQIKLLQKIEELTLYSIEQNKQIQSQSEQLQSLRKENEILKTQSYEIQKLKEQVGKLINEKK